MWWFQSSRVDTCPVKPLPFEDHPSTQACQTSPRKSRPGNHWQWYTHGLLVHWCRNQVVVKSQLCHCVCSVWKLAFDKSGHISCHIYSVNKYTSLIIPYQYSIKECILLWNLILCQHIYCTFACVTVSIPITIHQFHNY